MFGFTATEIALLVTAFGGGSTLQAALAALKARRQGAYSREQSQNTAVVAELARARESENEAWERADAMEARYDRMTVSRNKWRERSHKQDIYHDRHCRTETDEYPPPPTE
ncbi:hypothetical protein EU244_026370 [Rhodococcus qingshengii]|uniref:hypothetical protein n=1 Tax=Rhodococcus qingshengii TaxID=334542 RepID=UPI0010A6A3A7|nr:hypothetical protein [Rhodococcus qingshengii]THJ69115.1 hypothetical protein EU244_22495 [Rhodococcus qingshengii]